MARTKTERNNIEAMPDRPSPDTMAALRERIAAIERSGPIRESDARRAAPLAFGLAELDAALPGGGLARGGLHEVVGSGGDMADGAATGFLLMLLGRLAAGGRPVLWCLNRAAAVRGGLSGSLYGPGLAAFGLDMERLILAQARNDTETLWAMEEGLHTPALAAVVAEVLDLDLTASRRLQLAAEAGGVTAFLLRPLPDRLQPTASLTRWRLGTAPGVPASDDPLPDVEVGQPSWRAELMRCRGGRPGSWRLVWQGPEAGLAVVDEREEPKATTLAVDFALPARARS